MDASPIKLNLGCGPKHWPGFVNVDLQGNWSGKAPDVAADVTKPLPFASDYADEIHAIHLLEHLYRWEAPAILADWFRVLKPGGLLALELPCLDKIAAQYAHALVDGSEPDARLTILGLYGDPAYKKEAMCHRWCYSLAELAGGLKLLGYVDIEEQRPQYHQPARDMRMVARKPLSLAMAR
jgi:predicted SAM-dependent methyltransferase